mmetsp:Transcript_36338/g.78375  ORF Transcript_36338/g.78375 Transcript_36338/m.78375 type:complete len:356 (+) Transcript_36338:699-1766(+)
MVVIDAPTPIEEPSSNHSPCSAEAVHRAGIHWVINMQLLEEHRCGLVDKGSNQSSGKGTATFHVATACSDGDQACKDAIAESTNIILLHDEVSEHEDCDATCGCRQGRVHCHLCGQSTIRSRFHGQSRARVEAIPTKPKSESAQHHQGQVVTLELLWIGEAPLSRPQNHGAGQTAHTAREVNHSTACKIHVAHVKDLGKPATTPCPGNNDRVDETGHEECKGSIGGALHTLCHCSAHNGSTRCAKRPLKEPTQHGALASIRGALNWCDHSSGLVLGVEVGTEKSVSSDEAVVILRAICKGPAQTPPTQSSTAHVDQILHQHVGGILCPAASSLQHGEASMHEHHKSSTKAKPSRV